MKYKLLGKSGLRVSELCLGAMTFGEEWGWGATRQESRRIFETFADAGGNFIDTADSYTNGTSEAWLGEFLGSDRDHFVVATKYGLVTNRKDMNACGTHRKHITHAIEASLKRLRTDYIDLYWVHAWDFFTSVEEVMRALDDLVSSGKVLYVGISDTPAWIVSQANTLASLRGWTQFSGLQIRYSLLDRSAERELLPMAAALDIGVTAWGTLGRGILTGKYGSGEEGVSASQPRRLVDTDASLNKNSVAVGDALVALAKKTGYTPTQIALRWASRGDNGVIPVMGARTREQLQENLGCLEVHLDPALLKDIEEMTRIEPGFPHDVLGSAQFQSTQYGDSLGLIDRNKDKKGIYGI